MGVKIINTIHSHQYKISRPKMLQILNKLFFENIFSSAQFPDTDDFT